MSAEMLDTAEETIIDYITCPHCCDYIQPPSVCCENGHFMCNRCKKQVSSCPVCKTENFPNKKNTIFDMILKEIYYPCANQENGCPGYFKHDEIKQHQQSCEYELLPCAYQGAGCPLRFKQNERVVHEEHCEYGVSCRILLKVKGTVRVACHWRGFRHKLQEHVLTNHEHQWHPQHLDLNVAFAWMLPIYVNFEKIELIQLKDVDDMFYFYTRSEGTSMQYLAVQYIGHHERCKDYYFSIEFIHEAKKVKYENSVIPSSVDIEDVYRSNNCFEVHYSFLKKHFLAERVIDCYVKIFKKNQAALKKPVTYVGCVLVED